ncbi:hypothetical protein B0H19DRAFT_1083342 [Mycena capillaripes]|nr:hypothetical protein B0H19DRAFT_1083342 [Mycena capillaripes]
MPGFWFFHLQRTYVGWKERARCWCGTNVAYFRNRQKPREHRTPAGRGHTPSTDSLPQGINLCCARLQGLKSQVTGALLPAPNLGITQTPRLVMPTSSSINLPKALSSHFSRSREHESLAPAPQPHFSISQNSPSTTAATRADIFQGPPPGAAKPSSHPSSQTNMEIEQPLHSDRRCGREGAKRSRR